MVAHNAGHDVQIVAAVHIVSLATFVVVMWHVKTKGDRLK